jgi:hypothetical protein
MKKTMILVLVALLAVGMFTGCHARRGYIVEHNGLDRPAVTHQRPSLDMQDMQDGFVDGANRNGVYGTQGDGLANRGFVGNTYNRTVSSGTYGDVGVKRAANPDPLLVGEVTAH